MPQPTHPGVSCYERGFRSPLDQQIRHEPSGARAPGLHFPRAPPSRGRVTQQTTIHYTGRSRYICGNSPQASAHRRLRPPTAQSQSQSHDAAVQPRSWSLAWPPRPKSKNFQGQQSTNTASTNVVHTKLHIVERHEAPDSIAGSRIPPGLPFFSVLNKSIK